MPQPMIYPERQIKVYPPPHQNCSLVVNEAVRVGMSGQHNAYSLIQLSHNRALGEPLAFVRWRAQFVCAPDTDPSLLAVCGPACLLKSPVDADHVRQLAKGQLPLDSCLGVLYRDTLPVEVWMFPGMPWAQLNYAAVLDGLTDKAKQLAYG